MAVENLQTNRLPKSGNSIRFDLKNNLTNQFQINNNDQLQLMKANSKSKADKNKHRKTYKERVDCNNLLFK